MISGFVSAVIFIGEAELAACGSNLRQPVEELRAALRRHAPSYEIIILANDVPSAAAQELNALTATVPDLEIFFLSPRVEYELALVAGLDNAIGEWIFMAPIMPGLAGAFDDALAAMQDDIDVVVLQPHAAAPKPGFSALREHFYSLAVALFRTLYRRFTRIDLVRGAPAAVLLSRSAASYLLKRDRPDLAVRALASLTSFAILQASSPHVKEMLPPRSFSRGMSRAFWLLFAASHSPMRLVSSAAIAASICNAFYTLYILAVALMKPHVAEGWITLSLQNSVMFFFYAVMLAFIAEYLIQMHEKSSGHSSYRIAREIKSNVFQRKQGLNVIMENRKAGNE